MCRLRYSRGAAASVLRRVVGRDHGDTVRRNGPKEIVTMSERAKDLA